MEEEETPYQIMEGSSSCRAFSAGYRFDLTIGSLPADAPDVVISGAAGNGGDVLSLHVYGPTGGLVAADTALTANPRVALRDVAPGTYTVEENCTGTVTFADGPAFDAFVASQSLVSMVQTAGPNPAVPNIMQGDARFISR